MCSAGRQSGSSQWGCGGCDGRNGDSEQGDERTKSTMSGLVSSPLFTAAYTDWNLLTREMRSPHTAQREDAMPLLDELVSKAS